jgi:hypothetical protein
VTRLILALLGSFGLVLGMAVAFLIMHRRHVRQWRRQNRSVDQLSRITSARRRALAFPLPPRWVAVRSSNTALIREVLGAVEPTGSWSEALSRARERSLFVSAPVDGWTLLIGGQIPDPVADVDEAYRFLVDLSREVGDVQFYAADRVLNFHAWAKLRDGRVQRAYAWAGETLWNEGRLTLEERLLGLRTRGYGEDVGELRYGETSAEQTNSERVPLLARRWGVDFATASELLLLPEGMESDDDFEARD